MSKTTPRHQQPRRPAGNPVSQNRHQPRIGNLYIRALRLEKTDRGAVAAGVHAAAGHVGGMVKVEKDYTGLR